MILSVTDHEVYARCGRTPVVTGGKFFQGFALCCEIRFSFKYVVEYIFSVMLTKSVPERRKFNTVIYLSKSWWMKLRSFQCRTNLFFAIAALYEWPRSVWNSSFRYYTRCRSYWDYKQLSRQFEVTYNCPKCLLVVCERIFWSQVTLLSKKKVK